MELPTEIKWSILLYLDIRSIFRCFCVDRGFFEVSDNEVFWKTVASIHFPPSVCEKVKEKEFDTFKHLVRSFYCTRIERMKLYNLSDISSSIKFRMTGLNGSGKSALILRFLRGEFWDDYYPCGIEESFLKNYQYEGRQFKLDILDCFGQEEYAALRDCYYRGGDVFIIVYSITERQSFKELDEFMQRMLMTNSHREDLPIVVVGNKSDLEKEREVTRKEGVEYASRFGAGFFETSAKTGSNVEEVFKKGLELFFSPLNDDPIFEIVKEQSSGKSKCCTLM